MIAGLSGAVSLLLAETESVQGQDIEQLVGETQAVAVQIKEDLEQLKPDVLKDTIEGWIPGLLSFGYRLLIALLIILIGIRLLRLIRKLLKKTFDRMDMDLSVRKFLLSVANAAGYTLIIFIAADKIGVPTASIIALLGSVGLTIGLSLQGSLANAAGGILIMLMRPFGIGDYISCSSAEGTVQNIGLVYTTLLTADNKQITIPNGSISNTTVTNVTAQKKRRIDIEVGISYSSDMKRAKEILYHIFKAHPLILEEEDITVYVKELADSAVIIGGRGWAGTEDYWTARWEIIESVKEQFDEAGIGIPFPQMDVNIHSSSDSL